VIDPFPSTTQWASLRTQRVCSQTAYLILGRKIRPSDQTKYAAKRHQWENGCIWKTNSTSTQTVHLPLSPALIGTPLELQAKFGTMTLMDPYRSLLVHRTSLGRCYTDADALGSETLQAIWACWQAYFTPQNMKDIRTLPRATTLSPSEREILNSALEETTLCCPTSIAQPNMRSVFESHSIARMIATLASPGTLDVHSIYQNIDRLTTNPNGWKDML
jgi:hypothetical protein